MIIWQHYLALKRLRRAGFLLENQMPINNLLLIWNDTLFYLNLLIKLYRKVEKEENMFLPPV